MGGRESGATGSTQGRPACTWDQTGDGMYPNRREGLRFGYWSAAIGAVAVFVVASMCGCGGGGDTAPPPKALGASSSERPTTSVGHGPPVRLSVRQRQAYRRLGSRACRGMTSLQAAERFRPKVRRAGVQRRFVKAVTEPTSAVEASPGYPRLVAAFYATTLPESERTPAAAGCAEELVAYREGGKASSDRTRQKTAAREGGQHQKGNK